MKAKTLIKKLEKIRNESLLTYGTEPNIIIYTPYQRERYGKNSWYGYEKIKLEEDEAPFIHFERQIMIYAT